MGDGVTTGADSFDGDGCSDGVGFAGADALGADGFREGFDGDGFNDGFGATDGDGFGFTDGVGFSDGVGATDGEDFGAGRTASMPPGKVAIRGRCLPRGCGLAFADAVPELASEASPIASVRLAKSLPLVASSGALFGAPSSALPPGREVRKRGDLAGVDRSPDPIVSYHPPKHRAIPPRPFTCGQQQWSAILQ